MPYIPPFQNRYNYDPGTNYRVHAWRAFNMPGISTLLPLALLVILTDKRLSFLLGFLGPALHVLIAGFLFDNAHIAHDFLCMFAVYNPSHCSDLLLCNLYTTT